ncbi:MAG: hypothetical protein PUI85_03290 [Eubacteriales bacterium]|nr:hypothetical protein [Eubacteriales bacterium]MDY3333225.1 hypothetical protein [Gallibacter sp.]
MKLSFISDDIINMGLRQLGATEIKSMSATLNIVKFKMPNGEDIIYLYEVKETGSIYLQRVEPYRKMLAKLFDEHNVVMAIKNDLEAFLNAYKSKNYETFISISKSMGLLDTILEEIFFMYNVDSEDLLELKFLVDDVHNELKRVQETSKRLER